MFDKECELVKENGGIVDIDGFLFLFVLYDMGWFKWGCVYNFLIGYGVVMGLLIGKVLDFIIRNKFCWIC